MLCNKEQSKTLHPSNRDNASFHVSRKTVKFLEEQSDWLTVIFLPKRSPNLNPVEIRVNRNLKKDVYVLTTTTTERKEIDQHSEKVP